MPNREIKRAMSSDQQIHIICDNYATHKMVERFFRDLMANRLSSSAYFAIWKN